MRKYHYALLCAFALYSAPAGGQVINGGNINLDNSLCATQGSVATRISGGWACLTPGTSGQVLQSGGAGANASWTTVTGTGTVTSVSLALPAIFTVSGSPVTAAGTLTGTLASQTTNLVWASPNGSTGAPTFRSLANADLPIVGIANGGTGQSSTAAAFNVLSPITTTGDLIIGNGASSATRLPIGTSGYVLTSNGTTAFWNAAGGGGTVTSVSLSLPAFINVTGSPITNTGTLTGTLASQSANAVFAAPNGISGAPTFRSLVAADITGGTSGQVLTSNGAGSAGFASAPTGSLGGISGLKISALGLTNYTATITANFATLRNAAGTAAVNVTSVSVSPVITASGANGLDTGTLAASTWYNEFIINNGTTTAGLFSLSATSPTMPSGYNYYQRVGAVRSDASVNKYLYQILQNGSSARYVVTASSNVPNPIAMISGSSGSPSTPTWTSVSVGAYVPPTASAIDLYGMVGGAGQMGIAPNNAYGAAANGNITSPPPIFFTNYGYSIPAIMFLESGNIYYASNATTSAAYVSGWEDNLGF